MSSPLAHKHTSIGTLVANIIRRYQMHEMQTIVTDVCGVRLSVRPSVRQSLMQLNWSSLCRRHSVQPLSNHIGLWFPYQAQKEKRWKSKKNYQQEWYPFASAADLATGNMLTNPDTTKPVWRNMTNNAQKLLSGDKNTTLGTEGHNMHNLNNQKKK